MLCPLVISVSRDRHLHPPAPPSPDPNGHCLFCGGLIGAHDAGERSCALCMLVTHLERPRIDDEVSLIWLPEMTQAALICLVRETHIRLHGAGEALDGDRALAVASPDRAALHLTRIALASRAGMAAASIGTDKPSELGQALRRLPRAAYDRRHLLLGSLRVLPAGRFFAGAEDVYPTIVESWSGGIAIRSAA